MGLGLGLGFGDLQGSGSRVQGRASGLVQGTWS